MLSSVKSNRFIPAGAGNTTGGPFSVPALAVHPRGRGEHSDSLNCWTSKDGSSPRARGTQRAYPRRRTGSRFIPAGAGNTAPTPSGECAKSVHPRGRGEHLAWRSVISSQTGSSPRARGTRNDHDDEHGSRRFIPAGAGNTSRTTEPSSANTVHPRGRGEHAGTLDSQASHAGSSPRARGTRASRG